MLAPTRRAATVALNRRCLLLTPQVRSKPSELPDQAPRCDRPQCNAAKAFSTSHARYAKSARTRGKGDTRWARINIKELNPDNGFSHLIRIKSVPELLARYESLGDAERAGLALFTLKALTERLYYEVLYKSPQGAPSPNATTALVFAQRLATDIKKNRVQTSSLACAFILRIYHTAGKVEAGNEWWEWLRVQDNDSGAISTAAYSAAIGFLASQQKSPVEIEALYREALSRWPGTFQAYYLSPNSILTDRDQHFTTRVHQQLLGAIAEARLTYGNTAEAYLALDTLFRLLPSEPFPPIVGHFIDNRPLSEALTVHAMACRSGRPSGYQRVRSLHQRMKTNSQNCPGHFGSILTARQMLSTLFLDIGAGGTTRRQVGWADQVVSVITHVMQVPGVHLLSPSERQVIVDIVFASIRKVLELLGSMGCQPTGESFNYIITNLAGFGKTKDVVRIALEDLRKMGLEPDDRTMRSILTAAGRIGDASLVKESWQGLVELKANGVQEGDVHGLIKACRQSGISDFARETIAEIKDELPEPFLQRIMQHLDNPEPDPELDGDAPDMSTYTSLLQKLQADLDVFVEKLQGQNQPISFEGQDLPMRFRRSGAEEQIAEADLRRIYDEMSTDPAAEKPLDSRKPLAVSPTGISLGELRFQTWKDINFLIAEGLRNDSVAATSPDGTPTIWEVGAELDQDTIFGLSDLPLATPDQSSNDDVEKTRQDIFRLRGFVPAIEQSATTVSHV